jgi:hypothetical protein
LGPEPQNLSDLPHVPSLPCRSGAKPSLVVIILCAHSAAGIVISVKASFSNAKFSKTA